VYLFAHCPSGRPPEIPLAEALPREVVYIGEAKDLNQRPLTGTHHRVDRYELLFGSGTDSLFVSFAPLYVTGCDDYHIQRMFSFYAEAKLVWEYTKRHNHPPVLHWKDKGVIPKWVEQAVMQLR
jgi:hypothetical protein